MKNLLFPVESSLHIFMTIFLPLNSSMIWILVRQGIASTVPDSSLIFCSDKAVLRLCIFTLYLRTKFKETSLYLQFDFIVFMHSFRSYYFLNQAWTNCSDTQNLWGAPDFLDEHILHCKKEKNNRSAKFQLNK